MASQNPDESLRVERRNRRAAVTVALNQAADALRSPDSSVEYLCILQEKLTRYLSELCQTDLEYRRFIKNDQLEEELQHQRTLQDRGAETICKLKLKTESLRRSRSPSSASREDVELDKLVRLLELSPATLAKTDYGQARRRKEVKNLEGIRRGTIPQPRKTQVVPSGTVSETIPENPELLSWNVRRPSTELLVKNSRETISDCCSLFGRDLVRCCDKVYDFSVSPQNASMLTGGGRFVKYVLFFANLVILLGGIVVFSVGTWALVDSNFMERLLGSDMFTTSAATLMTAGCIVVLVSLLGCLGAFKEVKCLLIVYFLQLLVVFIIMLAGGVVGYVFRGDVDKSVYKAMWESIPLYNNDTAVTHAWDEIQKNFMCCGMRDKDKPTDRPLTVWKRNRNFSNNIRVPNSCCMRAEWIGGCRKNPTERDTYMEDCHVKVRDFIKSHALALGAVGITVACLVLLGMVLSCALILIIQ